MCYNWVQHKMLNMMLALSNPILSIALLLGLLTSAAALGDILLRRVGFTFDSPLERMLFAVGLGLAIFVYATVGLAAVGKLYPAAAWGLFVAGLIAAAVQVRRFAPSSLPVLTRIEMLLVALLLVFTLIYLIAVLSPPVDWDAQMYHLEAPARYIRAHRYVYIPNGYTNFPQFAESVYTFAMLIRDDILARLVNLALGGLATLALYATARRFVERSVALLASLIFLSSPLVGIAFIYVFIEAALTFYSLTAILALLKWRDSGDQHWLWLGAILSGFALGIKYYAIILIPILLWATLERAWWLDRRPARDVARLVVMAMVLALIFPLPWLIKNAILIGDPVFPVISSLLGRWGQGIAQANWHHFGMGYRPLDYVLLPWRMTFSDRFGITRPGPLFLILLPVLVGLPRTPHSVRWLASVVFLWFVFWANSAGQSVRFFVPGLALLSVVLVVAADHLSSHVRWLRYALLAVAILGSIYNFYPGPIRPMPHAYRSLPVITGQQSRPEYLTRHLDIYPLADYANRSLPPSARIATVWEERSYYFNQPLVIGQSPDGAFLHRFVVGDDPATLASALLSHGITHLIINDNIANWHEFHMRDRFIYGVETSSLLVYDPVFRACFLRALFDHKGITLYEVLSDPICPGAPTTT
jgi:hypothetical protein